MELLARKGRITKGQINGLWEALVIIFFLVPVAASAGIREAECTECGGTGMRTRDWILLPILVAIGWLIAICIDIIIVALTPIAAIFVFLLTWKEKSRPTTIFVVP